MLSTEELTQLRASINSTLTSTVTVLRRTTTRGKAGGEVSSYASSGTQPCRVIPIATPKDVQIASSIADQANAKLVLPWDADILNTDRLEVTRPGSEVTEVFEVIGLVPSNEQLSVQAFCTRIDTA